MLHANIGNNVITNSESLTPEIYLQMSNFNAERSSEKDESEKSNGISNVIRNTQSYKMLSGIFFTNSEAANKHFRCVTELGKGFDK